MSKLKTLKIGQEVQISFTGKGWWIGTLESTDFKTAKISDAFQLYDRGTHEGFGQTIEGPVGAIWVYPTNEDAADTWSPGDGELEIVK